MWAAIRLIRAMRVFGTIFLSYLTQMVLERLFGQERLRERWRSVHKRNARRMYKGFVRLRGVYIKLGQILSVMGSFLPRVYTHELEGLQDEVPAQPYRKIKKTFIRAFGKTPHELFTTFAEEPVAAASLGQVHQATNAAGDRLAVKILYPNVATIIRIDLKVLGWALRVYRTFVPIHQIERVHEQLTDMLERETDLLNEARCIKRMSANFADDPDILFPTVHDAMTTRDVMTMSFMDGFKITKHEALKSHDLAPEKVATKLIQMFYKQLFADRFFHADPHPGNFFVQRGPQGQPRIVVLDLGSASDVTDNLAQGMLDILTGMMTRKDDLVVQGIETMGFVAEGGDRALLEKTVRRYFEKLLNLNISDFSKISPDMAKDLADFDMKRDELRELMKSIEYPPGWFYVERAVVIMFGLSATLAPKINTFQIGFPYIMKFLTDQRARQAAAAAKAPAPVATPAAAPAAASTSTPELESDAGLN